MRDDVDDFDIDGYNAAGVHANYCEDQQQHTSEAGQLLQTFRTNLLAEHKLLLSTKCAELKRFEDYHAEAVAEASRWQQRIAAKLEEICLVEHWINRLTVLSNHPNVNG